MLKIFENFFFFFKVLKRNTKKERLEKPDKEKLLLLISENRCFVFVKLKYQLNIEV